MSLHEGEIWEDYFYIGLTQNKVSDLVIWKINFSCKYKVQGTWTKNLCGFFRRNNSCHNMFWNSKLEKIHFLRFPWFNRWMFQLFEEQATSASQWVLFIWSKRDNTIMKPGRKWVQVIKFHHFIVQNCEIPFQVLSSLAAALCQGACGHCVPLSAYVIPQVLHVNPQYRFQTPFPQRAQILYDVWLLVPPADDPKLLLSWRRTQGTRSQWLQKKGPGLVSK